MIVVNKDGKIMEIVIGLIVAACIEFNNFLEDRKTKNMSPDQRWDYDWKQLEKKYKFGRYKK